MATPTPFDFIQAATREHRQHHGCGAYTFEDGPGLLALVAAEQPQRVLELGTALGFTACCLASATPTTQVDTLERDPQHVALAREQITQAGLAARVAVHHGEFSAVLGSLAGPYDLAFFDGFAPDAVLIRQLRALLRAGGVLVCSNLGLAQGDARSALEQDLHDTARWVRLTSLEGGGTQAFRKCEPL